MRRIISLLLAAALLFGLAACGGDRDGDPEDTGAEATRDPETVSAQPTAMDYAVNQIDLPMDMADINAFAARDGYLYFCYAGTEAEDTYAYTVARMPVDGGELTVIQEADYIADIAFDSGGNLWTCSTEDGESFRLMAYTGEGELTLTLDLPEQVDTELYPLGLNIDGEDNLYLTLYTDTRIMVYVLDTGGQLLFDVELTGSPVGFVTTAEGSVGICTYDAGAAATDIHFFLSTIDRESEGVGDTVDLGIFQNISDGLSHSLYLADADAAYGYDLASGERTTVVNWMDVDMTVTTALIAELEDGRLAVLGARLNQSAVEYSFTLVILGKSDGQAAPEKTVLTLATLMSDDTLAAAVTAFNARSDEYRIEIDVYLPFSDQGDSEKVDEALARFNTEAISGQMPDIVNLMYLPVDMYAARGMLEDLYTYIDSDSELSRDDFFENLLEAMSVDGKLAYVTNGVVPLTLIGDADVFGNQAGINTAGLRAILEQHDELEMPLGFVSSTALTSDALLTYMLYGNLDFIDWETGTCRFDSDEFINLLNLAALLPEASPEPEIDFENLAALLDSSQKIAEGEQLGAVEQLIFPEQLANYKRNLGGNYTIVGLPVEDGVGHIAETQSKLGITSTSAHKEAAWDFVRQFLLDDTQMDSLYLPISRSAFEAKMESGSALTEIYYEGVEVTDDDIAALRGVMETTIYTTNYDMTLFEIVDDETAALFAGEITAEQCADRIQNRVQTYVNERL